MIKGKTVFINSGNLQLWTERFGDPADPVVLLIMGTSAQGIGWPDELVEVLADGGRQVIRFDHRDTGQSDCVDFAAAPYTISDMAGDALAVLDGHQVTALPAPSPEFLRHVAAMASSPPAKPQDRITANVETWRILNGTTLPFDADAARRHVETSVARARDFQAANHHDPAGQQMTPERQAPLTRVTAPTLVIHGTDDPLLPLANGRALAALIPGARFEAVPGMGHGFFSPAIPAKIARLMLDHTAARP